MADVVIGNANISKAQLIETTTPASPASTKWYLYVKSGGLYLKDSAGTEYQVGGKTFSLKGGASGVAASLSGNAATQRGFTFMTGTSLRWALQTEETAESGSDAGSNFRLVSYTDAGAPKTVVMQFTRSNGNVAFSGTMSKGGGSFDIDHPLDPTNRNLIHSFVEGPRADLMYRGKVALVNGQAMVSIDTASGMTPGTFEALTKHAEADIFLQNVSGWEAVRGTLVGGTLTITTQHQRPADTDTIAWLVVAERNDAFYRACDLTDEQGRFIVEVDKPAPTPEELAQLTPAESDDITEITHEILPSLIGKRGYPKHAHLTGLPVPQREIRPHPKRKPRL